MTDTASLASSSAQAVAGSNDWKKEIEAKIRKITFKIPPPPLKLPLRPKAASSPNPDIKQAAGDNATSIVPSVCEQNGHDAIAEVCKVGTGEDIKDNASKTSKSVEDIGRNVSSVAESKAESSQATEMPPALAVTPVRNACTVDDDVVVGGHTASILESINEVEKLVDSVNNMVSETVSEITAATPASCEEEGALINFDNFSSNKPSTSASPPDEDFSEKTPIPGTKMAKTKKTMRLELSRKTNKRASAAKAMSRMSRLTRMSCSSSPDSEKDSGIDSLENSEVDLRETAKGHGGTEPIEALTSTSAVIRSSTLEDILKRYEEKPLDFVAATIPPDYEMARPYVKPFHSATHTFGLKMLKAIVQQATSGVREDSPIAESFPASSSPVKSPFLCSTAEAPLSPTMSCEDDPFGTECSPRITVPTNFSTKPARRRVRRSTTPLKSPSISNTGVNSPFSSALSVLHTSVTLNDGANGHDDDDDIEIVSESINHRPAVEPMSQELRTAVANLAYCVNVGEVDVNQKTWFSDLVTKASSRTARLMSDNAVLRSKRERLAMRRAVLRKERDSLIRRCWEKTRLNEDLRRKIPQPFTVPSTHHSLANQPMIMISPRIRTTLPVLPVHCTASSSNLRTSHPLQIEVPAPRAYRVQSVTTPPLSQRVNSPTGVARPIQSMSAGSSCNIRTPQSTTSLHGSASVEHEVIELDSDSDNEVASRETRIGAHTAISFSPTMRVAQPQSNTNCAPTNNSSQHRNYPQATVTNSIAPIRRVLHTARTPGGVRYLLPVKRRALVD